MSKNDDRELLEMAAKAAGLTIHAARQAERDEEGGANSGLWIVNGSTCWNPLTDDGDALRLAVKLRLTVSWDRYDYDDYATATPPHTHQGYDCMVDQDPYAAARRAIVRAAAEIGKAMP